MAYPDGFTHIQGPYELRRSTLSSTATVRAGNPVTFSDDRTIIEAASDTTAIYGIIQHNAADSLGGSLVNAALILVPTECTVFAVKLQTGVATSATSPGQSYGIEKSGNYFRLDTDSQATPMVTIVERGDGTTVDSADSTVYVQFLKDRIAPWGSNASVSIFAQD